LPDLTVQLTIPIVFVLAACASAPAPQRVTLCDALAAVRAGQSIPVTVSGVIMGGTEIVAIYDPQETVCSQNIQPGAWVEFLPGAMTEPLQRLLAERGAATVLVSGVLHGPRIVATSPKVAPELNARAVATNRRYGHLNMFRTELLVDRVLSAEPAPAGKAADWNAIPAGSAPRVQSARVPSYPELARAAQIAGDVRLRVTVVGGEVRRTEVLSGDPLLAQAAQENVGTWHFEAAVQTEIETLFSFRLERRARGDNMNPRVEAFLPDHLTITAAADDW
jgi:hypothetical protein